MQIGFLEITLLDLFDVLIVGYLMYQIYKLLKGSLAFNIFLGLVLIYVLWWLVDILNMDMLSLILNQVVSVGVILLLIVFQPEVRRFLLFLGKSFLRQRSSFIAKYFDNNLLITQKQKQDIHLIRSAIEAFSKTKTGALIVFTENPEGLGLSNQGTILNANISNVLLKTIFYKDSPLHDGAMIIYNGQVYSAGAVLPVSQNVTLPKDVGLRHRAGVGITEGTSVLALMVSEETGTVSIAKNGQLERNISFEELENILEQAFK
ncbi:MAG: diadenylate cyclase [Saprospiraceae bacterium]